MTEVQEDGFSGNVGGEKTEKGDHYDETGPEEDLDAEDQDWVRARSWEEPGGAGAAAASAGLVS